MQGQAALSRLAKGSHHPSNVMSRHRQGEGTAILGTAVTKASSSLLLCLWLLPGQETVALFVH